MNKKLMLTLTTVALSIILVGCGSNPDAQKYVKDHTPKDNTVQEIEEPKEEVVKKEYTVNDYIQFRSGLESTIGLDEGTCETLYIWCKNNEEIMMFEKALSPNIFDINPKLLDE